MASSTKWAGPTIPIRSAISELCGRAGVHKIRLHDARHSCASIMHAQGVPIAAISAWLGHRDTAFTMRTYVHAQNDALKQPRPLCNVL